MRRGDNNDFGDAARDGGKSGGVGYRSSCERVRRAPRSEEEAFTEDSERPRSIAAIEAITVGEAGSSNRSLSVSHNAYESPRATCGWFWFV